jgi:hypothetical protein
MRAFTTFVLLIASCSAAAAEPSFDLTARPWQPLNVPRDAYLDAVESVCRFTAKHVNADGAVIDPLLKREHQYSTPYFAFAVGALARAGRAKDLLPAGVAAMDHATGCFAKGSDGIPDNHGEFFIPVLTGALELYDGLVPADTMERWRERLRTPVDKIVRGQTNNWRAYAMRGQWLRFKAGLVDRDAAVAFIEDGWIKQTQRERIALDQFHLYEDRGTDPESHAVEPVGRGNLLGLSAAGYDGLSAGEIAKNVDEGSAVTLTLQDPSGQCPPDGRADDHVFNDVLYQLCFDVMAQRAKAAGDTRLAGQYRHAAMLAFKSIKRWHRTDGEWAGSYYITKNHFDPADRVGYQRASNITNYNGAVMLHLAEAYLARTSEIAEEPSPTEIGGYAFATDAKFASAVADAGGMQMFAALRGDTKLVYDHYWTSLGVNRFARVGWETRLGPGDGVRDAASGVGVTFAPTWMEDGKWVRLASVSDRYAGKFSVQFAHPLLLRCAIDYAALPGKTGPHFRHEFLITPDGVLTTLKCDDAPSEFGVTWPLLNNDGAELATQIAEGIAITSYKLGEDEQCFLAVGVGEQRGQLDATEESVQGTYGWLKPVRATCGPRADKAVVTFVYPRNATDPAADVVRSEFRLSDDGFTCNPLARIRGNTYVGRTSAGGEGNAIDLDGDGKDDATFDAPCKFVLQLREGKIVAAEADRKVIATIAGKQITLERFVRASGLGG